MSPRHPLIVLLVVLQINTHTLTCCLISFIPAAVLPTANFPRQAQPVSYPGQHAAYPGQQAAHPGQQAAHPGQQVAYPGQQVAYPGPQAVHPGQQAAYPVGEQPAAAAAAASAGAIAGDQPPSYDDIVSGNDYPVKPTHAEHVF